MNTNQLGKAADAAWQVYEQACVTWAETLVPAEGGKHSTDLGDGLTITSRLRCAANIPSGIRDEIARLRSEKPDFDFGLSDEDEDGSMYFVRHTPDEGRVGCVETASSITKEHRVWLWPGYLGRNKVAHFGGSSTEGKSPVTLDIAARVSAGLPWPDGTKNELGPRGVIVLAAEDDWSDTIIPRLELAGANLNNIHRFFVTQKTVEITPSLDADCQLLERRIKQIGDVALVVIDPITNYLGTKQMNAEEQIRGGIMMPLSLVARQHNCSIITVGHLNKRGSDAAVLQRLMGAAAFVGVARDVFIFGPDPDEDDKYAHTMSEMRNKSAPQLKYRTEAVNVVWGGQESEVIKVKWCGVSHADVDDVVNAPRSQDKSITSKAVMLISGMLRSGAKRKADIDQALKENGIDPEALQFNRIKKRCKAEVRALKGKSAGWEWFLATPEQATFDESKGATHNAEPING